MKLFKSIQTQLNTTRKSMRLVDVCICSILMNKAYQEGIEQTQTHKFAD